MSGHRQDQAATDVEVREALREAILLVEIEAGLTMHAKRSDYYLRHAATLRTLLSRSPKPREGWRPDSDTLTAGFRCARHAALSILARTSAPDAGESREEAEHAG